MEHLLRIEINCVHGQTIIFQLLIQLLYSLYYNITSLARPNNPSTVVYYLLCLEKKLVQPKTSPAKSGKAKTLVTLPVAMALVRMGPLTMLPCFHLLKITGYPLNNFVGAKI